MKFYIAAFVDEKDRVQECYSQLRALGHQVTLDWTRDVGIPIERREELAEEVRKIAVRDMEGILN